MKSLIIIWALLFSSFVSAYPLGFKATTLTTKYPALVDFGFLKATNSGSTTTVSSLGAALGDSLVLGGTINANAILDAQSTTKAFMPPRMTTTQKNAISSPTAGMQVFDTTLNSMSYYDGTAWGFGVGNLLLDNLYSAQARTTTGVVSAQNKSFIASCTAANPSVCTFTSGYFTTTPNCTTGLTEPSTAAFLNITSMSSSSVSVYSYSIAGSPLANVAFTLSCQKSGVDYTNSSSSVFTGASANYDWTSLTPTMTNLGTSPSITCKQRRVGGDLEMECNGSTGSSVPTAISSITLPNSLAIDTTKIVNATSNGSNGQAWGTYNQSGAATNNISGVMISNTNTSANVLYFGNYPTTASQLIAQNGSAILVSSTPTNIKIKVPISGWSNLSQVVANISGYAQVPGVAGSANSNVDTFSVSFGTTNVNTVCSSSPCFIDQIGTGVSSINRTSAGTYVLNTVRSYTKLRCTGNAGYLGGGLRGVLTAYVPSSPSSTVNFETVAASTGNNLTDSYGTLNCMGSY